MESKIDVLDIPEDTRYWFVRANSQSQYYEDFLYNNYIAVDSNEFSLATLFKIPSTLRSSKDALLEKYKQLFEAYDLKLFNSKVDKEELSDDELKKEKTKELRRSSNRSNRIFHFVEEINISDFVIVPYKSSDKFLIGVVTSDCFEENISHLQLLDEDGNLSYDICPFSFKRRVLWIKELSRKQFPDSLSWIKTAHQSLFDITEYAEKLNPCINPIYRYKGNVNYRIGVNTKQNISSSSWLEYQTLLKKLIGHNLDNLYQKQKVQSPGEIVLYVVKNYWWIIPLIMAGLFGDVEINHGPVKMKFQGIIRYFSKDEKLKRKLLAEKVKTELTQEKANIDNTDADTLNKLKDVNKTNPDVKEITDYIVKSVKERQLNNLDRINTAFSESEETKNIAPTNESIENDAEKVVSDFKLSNEDPGSLIQYENQADSLNIPSEESYKNKGKES